MLSIGKKILYQEDNMKKTIQKKQTALIASQNTTPETLIMQGINKGVSVDTMERLLIIRREVKVEQAREAFNFAMSAFQSECPTVKKNKGVKNKDGSMRYKFASLDFIVEQVRPFMQKYRLSYTIDAEVDDKWVRATCRVTHELGHSETSTFKVPVDANAFMSQPQKFAAALTFAKRYAFCNVLGILTGDDDTDAVDTKMLKEKPKATVLSQDEKFQSALVMIKACEDKKTVETYYKSISEKGPKAYNEEQMAVLMDTLIEKIEELKKK